MIVDLFAGTRGWSEGLSQLGLHDVGIEWDHDACATAVAAGHATIRADVEQYPTAPFVGKVDGLIASPPCTDWSTAGAQRRWDGESGRLVLEVARWVEALRPRWVACEQVPPALEVWVRFAHDFTALGYRCWAGILNAADFGVPQTRRRAFLLCSLEKEPHPPMATHARNPDPVLFGEALLPWVSMADALDWVEPDDEWRHNNTDSNRSRNGGLGRRGDQPAPTFAPGHSRPRMKRQVGFPRLDDVGDSPDGYRVRDWTDETEPAPVVTEKARSWSVRDVVVNTGRDWKPGGTRDDAQRIPITAPAPAIDSKGRWFLERPATTIQGDPRVWPPGHKVNGADRERLGAVEADARYGDRAGSEALRITIEDALLLQSFRPDYPLVGNRTSQFRQVGNAVPPLLARHVLAALL